MFRGTTTETLPRRSCGNWSGKTCLRWRRFAAKNWQFWCRQTHPGVNPSPRGQPAQAKTGARRHEGQSGRRLQGRPYSPPLIMTAPERILGTPGGTVIPPALAWRRAGHPEAGSRVPVVGVVPVAAAGADVPRIVIARTAAHHTPAGGRPGFRLMAGAASIAGADRTDRKIGWRERHISHGAAGTTMSGTGLLVATNRVSIPVYLTQPPTPAP